MTCLYCTWSQDYYRKVLLTYNNNTHEDFADTPYAVFIVNTTPLTDIVIQNDIWNNVSAYFGIIVTQAASNSVLIENIIYKDSQTADAYNIRTTDSNQITMRNITHQNVTTGTSLPGSFIEASLLDNGNFTAEDIYFKD